jgi:hypothetical protein
LDVRAVRSRAESGGEDGKSTFSLPLDVVALTSNLPRVPWGVERLMEDSMRLVVLFEFEPYE